MTRSATASRLCLHNDPSPEEIVNGRRLCVDLLEPIRSRWGPLRITSGFRCLQLNQAINGRTDSAHLWRAKAAADFQALAAKLEEVFNWIRLESGLPFDQVVLELGHQVQHDFDDCIHIASAPSPRRQAFLGATHNFGPYEPVQVNA